MVKDRRRRPGPIRPRAFALMFGESLIYAMLLGAVVATLTGILLGGPALAVVPEAARLTLSQQLVISLGAGLYEELLFRVLLVSGFTAVGLRLKWRPAVAVGVAVLASALLFSAFHYIGPLGDPLELGSFAFRAIAGLLLSALYVLRGFGIVAWTHALYDIGLAVTGRW